MVVDTTLYDIIGADPNCTQEELRSAYKKKAFLLHPDKNKDDPNSTEKFQELNEAYEVLKNEETRKVYDEHGPEGLRDGGMGEQFGDIFEHIFGGFFGGKNTKQKTRDIRKEVEVTLEELFNGCEKVVEVQKQVLCSVCNGNGTSSGKKSPKCSFCNGTGAIATVHNLGGMLLQSSDECIHCKGLGEIISDEDQCSNCKGEKILKINKNYNVHIEPGMETGSQITFQGESNEIPNVESGNLVFIVKEIPHSIFKRKNKDLLMIKEITLYDALFTSHYVIETLNKHQIIIDKGLNVIEPGQVKVIQGEGMPEQNNTLNTGNLYIEFKIIFPTSDKLTNQLKESLALIQPPIDILKTIDINDENVSSMEINDAQMSDFNNSNNNNDQEKYNEYSDDNNNNNDEEDFEDFNDGDPQMGCQPM